MNSISNYNPQNQPKQHNSNGNIQNKQIPRKPNHSQHAHDQLDSDCQGCQAQKKQNQKLVDFYHRLDKISNKVKKYKSSKNTQNIKYVPNQEVSNEIINIDKNVKQIITPQNLQQKLKQLDKRLDVPQLPSISQIKEFSSKQIGFELAAALIQREMKYKNENKKLQQKINELLAQKKKKEENQHKKQNTIYTNTSKLSESQDTSYINNVNDNIEDSLDDFKNNKIRNKRKPKDDSSFWNIDDVSINNNKYQESTFFETKNKDKDNSNKQVKTKFISKKQYDEHSQLPTIREKNKNPYNTDQGYGLNLWLYQFKADQNEKNVKNSWNVNKNDSSVFQRYGNEIDRKQLNNSKISRVLDIKKSGMIQKKRMKNDNQPLIANKRRRIIDID